MEREGGFQERAGETEVKNKSETQSKKRRDKKFFDKEGGGRREWDRKRVTMIILVD